MAARITAGAAGIVESTVAQGVWTALVGPLAGGGAPPDLTALHDGAALPGLAITAEAAQPGFWRMRLPLPAELIGDRVAVVLLRLGEGAAAQDLGRVSIAAGQALIDDLAAEVAALRAEMELLKAVVRRIGRAEHDRRAEAAPTETTPAPPGQTVAPAAAAPLQAPDLTAAAADRAVPPATTTPETPADPAPTRPPRSRSRRTARVPKP